MKLLDISTTFSAPTEVPATTVSGLSRVVLPLATPWGEMKPQCHLGDSVEAGQLVAKSDDPRLPAVYASISGQVTAIQKWPLYKGKEGPVIVIEGALETSTHEDSRFEGEHELVEIANNIVGCGISEADSYPWPLPMRLASPNLAKDLWNLNDFPFNVPIDTLIINGLDRQPGDFLRSWTISHSADSIAAGIRIAQKMAAPSRTVLAVTNGQTLPDELEETLKELNIEIRRCPNKYPIGLEPVLIRFITGKEVPQPSGDARSIGSAVVDVIGVAKIGKLGFRGSPALETTFQLSFPSRGIHKIVRAPIGTILQDVLALVDGSNDQVAKIIMGGLCLGYAQYDNQVPITQEVESIFIQTSEEVYRYSNTPCINCGYCVQVCPMNLLPNELGKFCEYRRFDEAEQRYLFHCIECGLCSYICPAKRPMVQLMRFGKQELREMRKES